MLKRYKCYEIALDGNVWQLETEVIQGKAEKRNIPVLPAHISLVGKFAECYSMEEVREKILETINKHHHIEKLAFHVSLTEISEELYESRVSEAMDYTSDLVLKRLDLHCKETIKAGKRIAKHDNRQKRLLANCG